MHMLADGMFDSWNEVGVWRKRRESELGSCYDTVELTEDHQASLWLRTCSEFGNGAAGDNICLNIPPMYDS